MDRVDLEGEVIDPLIGTMIGRFRVEKKIGQGGMGAVYELLQPAIHKRMALKLLHEEYAARREIVQRFFDEARAVNLIGHPSIVDITDFSHLPDGRPFILMEFLDGESLEDYLQEKGALGENDTLDILRQICSALGAAHAKHIVHRDLKPENIYLVRHPHQPMRVKVLDFGIAKLKDKSGAEGITNTQTGVVLGTPTYMSPEQAQGNTLAADHRTDIYSLGAMLHQMLSGAPPFSGATFASLIFKHISEAPPPLSDLRGDIAPAWTHIVAKALAKAPGDRYQSMQALLDDATAAVATKTTHVAEAPVEASARHQAVPARRTPLLAILAPLVVLAGLAVWWLAKPDDSREAATSTQGPALVSATSGAATTPDAAPEPAEADAALGVGAGATASIDAGASQVPATAPPATAPPATVPPATNVVPPEKRPASSQKNPKSRGKGTLRVNANPWAQVYLDGKRIGQTPLRESIPAGHHKVRLRNETTGKSKTHRIQLKKGGTYTIRERW